jgi:hypothetical protein
MRIEEVSVGITGFIDILGFRARVESARELEDIDALRVLIEKIRGEFDFESTDKLTAQGDALYAKTILAFSDCVVVNLPLTSAATRLEGTFDPLMSELTSFAYAQSSCVGAGLFLRGGLDLGWWYRSGDVLVSSSLVGAHKAETKTIFPVISLTSRLYEHFSSHEHRTHYSSDSDPIPRSFRWYEGTRDGEKVAFWYIDYISICIDALEWDSTAEQREAYRLASDEEKSRLMSDGYRATVNKWLSHHARRIETAFVKAASHAARDKYVWLSSYHNEIAQLRSSTEECLCSVRT